MKKDNWTSEFRERMDSYTVTPPNDVWEKLDKELSSTPATKVRIFSFTTIAAIITLLLLSSVGIYLLTNYKPDKNIPQILSESLPTENQPHCNDNLKSHERTNIMHHGLPTKKETFSSLKRTDKQIINNEIINQKVNDSERENNIIIKEKVPAKEEHSMLRTKKRKENSEAPTLFIRKKSKRSKWAISITAGNNIMASNESYYGFNNLNSFNNPIPTNATNPMSNNGKNPEELKEANAYSQIMFRNINQTTQTRIKHHLPVSVGLSLRKNISSNFSIETGLMYTLLSSELKAGNESYYSQEQKLHYLGVPLKINWNFIQKQYFTVYLSAGGMMEGCVSSRLTTNYETKNEESFSQNSNLKNNHLQWSVSGAVGAQYNINRYIGIFIEPGVIYYFDDGSDIATIRKEKPLNINFQAGLRFGF